MRHLPRLFLAAVWLTMGLGAKVLGLAPRHQNPPAMLARLKRHPFPVVARFDRVMAVSFALPQETLAPLVPEPLEIDSWEGLGFETAMHGLFTGVWLFLTGVFGTCTALQAGWID